MNFEEKCETCWYYRKLFEAKYCRYYDTPKNFWEGRKNKDEIICDRYLSKNASFEEQINYMRNQYEKQIKLEIWDENDKEWDEFTIAHTTPSERFRMKQESKRMLSRNKKFIDKYPILNPNPP